MYHRYETDYSILSDGALFEKNIYFIADKNVNSKFAILIRDELSFNQWISASRESGSVFGNPNFLNNSFGIDSTSIANFGNGEFAGVKAPQD